VVDTYNIGDELEGNVTKVVTFGAFVEILDGVEGLVHISELAQHHVENPREIIQPGDPVRVKILEIDSERRRLSLSIKRVEGQVLPVRPIEPPTDSDEGLSEAGDLDHVPELGLSEDVFATDPGPPAEVESEPEGTAESEPAAELEDRVDAPASDATVEAPAATDEAAPAEELTDEAAAPAEEVAATAEEPADQAALADEPAPAEEPVAPAASGEQPTAKESTA
jgi:small subunit ribosomal protein S1